MPSQVPSSIKATIGANLRAARKRQGLTQRELAALVGVPDLHISRWERGAHRPSDANLYALAEALGLSYVDFYVERAA